MFRVGRFKNECLYSILPPISHLCFPTDKEGGEDSKGRGSKPGPLSTWLIYYPRNLSPPPTSMLKSKKGTTNASINTK